MARRREPSEFFEQFAAIKRRVSALATQTYATVELGSMQAKLLRDIGQHSPISQAELARHSESDPTLIGRALAALIERGLVRRERSEEDRREYVVELSAAGKRMRDKIETLRVEMLEKIVAQLDEKDLADFERISAKVIAALA